MRAALIPSFVAFAAIAIAAPASAATIASVDMCDVDPAAYTQDLNDNDFVAKLHERLTAGTVTCDRQTMERIGTVGGQTYMLWQAWFTDGHEGSPSPATVAQIGEIGTDGKLTIVYRLSLIDSSDALAAKAVEQEGKTILAITTPAEHFLLRGETGFQPIDVQWEIDDKQMAAALPEGDLLPTSGGREVGGDITHFNLDAMALDVPIAVATEVYPRTYADPDYDRPLTLRFPLVLRANQLVPGNGEVVEPEQNTPNGIGETPEFLSIPKDVQACEIRAWLEDDDPQGVAVHAAPSTKGAVIAALPAAGKEEGDGAEVTVVGSIDDWFLIENAVHPAENYGDDFEPAPGTGSNLVRRTYRGRGWVHGSRLSTGIQTGEALRASADPQSKAVFDLKLDPQGGESYVTITGFKSCKGEALDVDVKRSDGVTGTGWIGGDDTSQLCSSQVTTCN